MQTTNGRCRLMKQLLRLTNSMWGWCTSCRYIRSVYYTRWVCGCGLWSHVRQAWMVYINFLYVWQLQRLVPLPLCLRYSTILVLRHLAVWPYIPGLLMYNIFHKYGQLQEQHNPINICRNRENSLRKRMKIEVVIICYSCYSHLCDMRRNSP